MATFQTQDANILDTEAVNWRLIVYPIVALIILGLGGLGLYYYHQSQHDDQELQARQAILKSKTPEALVQVADKFPGTSQANFALLAAAQLSLEKHDFPGAEKNYQRVASSTSADSVLKDSAELGLAATQELENKLNQALSTYLTVARHGRGSPYAPYAYSAAAAIYAKQKDSNNERKILIEAAGLGNESPFTQEAAERLKMLTPPSPTPASNAATLPSIPAAAATPSAKP